MQGTQAFDPKAKTAIDLDSFVGDHHLLRRMDRILKLSFVRELAAACYADGRGRPSIDPEVYFRMRLVAYLYGITSDRRLCEEVRYNLAYRWFCRLSLEDDVPDHSPLSRIQNRYGEAIFLAVFRHIVALCQQKGLVKQQSRVMTDARLIAADASLDSLIHNDPEQAQKEEPLLVARKVSRPGESADPSLSVRDCTEPQTPALPALPRAGGLVVKPASLANSTHGILDRKPDFFNTPEPLLRPSSNPAAPIFDCSKQRKIKQESN